ncbi:hypothetical protein D2962_09620 [Biomaibacter acetigenes]|uniref:Uncharacterized protein n=1 Tax=Biomaibacter acetigenes TaxID=2316383 RepID=A0A3G2R6W6_9FIRM|nr:hypothetical protein [Biomaibacter acetigenes]AYO30838.1 hypothetical protein D2962_09620 [Biomaibacter acetigenes]
MIPKIIEKESGPPEGMTEEQLQKILYPNLLAMARILAQEIKKEKEEGDHRCNGANTVADG